MERVIDTHVYFSVNIFGKTIPFITDAVVNMWLVMAIIMIATLIITRNLKPVPAGGQKIAETVVDFIGNMAKTQISSNYKPYVPYIGAMLLFITCSNIIAIFNFIPSGSDLAIFFNNPALESFEYEIAPPTKNFNVTLCLALISMVVVISAEFKHHGLKGWLRGFIYPTPVSWFIKILDYVVRPMSLCLRLFGNIVGGYIVMTLLYMSMPAAVPAIIGMYFDIFDGGLQAYVFVFLTMLYLSEAVAAEEF